MCKVIFSLGIGISGCRQEADALEELGLTFAEWKVLNEEEKQEHLRDWIWEYIDAGYKEGQGS